MDALLTAGEQDYYPVAAALVVDLWTPTATGPVHDLGVTEQVSGGGFTCRMWRKGFPGRTTMHAGARLMFLLHLPEGPAIGGVGRVLHPVDGGLQIGFTHLTEHQQDRVVGFVHEMSTKRRRGA